jgi:hypothetical protein
VAASLALAAGVALAGCGSGSSAVSPAAYVRSLCSAVYPWERAIQVNTAKLAVALRSISTPAQGKLALRAYLTIVSASTDSMIPRLRQAGSPSVKNGKAISSTILGAFVQVGAAMHQGLALASQLPTDSQAAYSAAVQRLDSVLGSVATISQRLRSPLNSPELHSAAAKEPACTSLGGL